MGYKLYREVRDCAPADLTPSELVVALMIADDARDETRVSGISRELLCERCRLAPDSVRHVLARLARRGYEFRVAHGAGADGRQVFSARSHATDYRVPDFAALWPGSPVDNWSEAASSGRLWEAKAASGGRKGGLRRPERRPQEAGKAASGGHPLTSVPQYPHIPHTEAGVIPPSVEDQPLGMTPPGPVSMIEREAWAAAARAAAARTPVPAP